MAPTKRRAMQHRMEEKSLQLVRQTLPDGWVVRDYKPDYGIDLAVEVFDQTRQSGSYLETVGEWFLVQVKSILRTHTIVLKAYPRSNVEKTHRPILEPDDNKPMDIEVIPCRIDTSILTTVQALGSGVPVLLFLVTLDTESVYFLCLNDAIDKCIIPRDEEFNEKRTKTIHIPTRNRISPHISPSVAGRLIWAAEGLGSRCGGSLRASGGVFARIEPLVAPPDTERREYNRVVPRWWAGAP